MPIGSVHGSVQQKLQASMPVSATPPPSRPDLGSQYQQLLDANPYRGQSYHRSPWQNVLSALGFRTQADAWEENMAVQAAEYDASIAQKAYDESYNTPQMQVERMRAAGLNPDIDGGSSINPGEAASLGQDPSTPMQSTGAEGTLGEAFGTAMQVASACLNSVATATGIVQSVQGIRRNHLDNIMQSINNEAGLQSLADEVLPYIIPPTNDGLFDEGDELIGTWKDNAYQAAKFFTGDMPKKMRGKFERALLNRLNSAPGERKAYEEWAGRIKARKETFSEKTQFYDESDEVLYIISEGLSEMNEKIVKATQNAQLATANAQEAEAVDSKEYFETRDSAQVASAENAESANREKYYNTLDPTKQATAENTSNDVIIANNEMMAIMRESLNGMVKKLDAASKDGGVKGGLASIAMALISGIQLYVSSQGMPSVSRSTSTSPSGAVKSSFSLNL